MCRCIRYLFENEYHTELSLPFRLRLLGASPFPVGDAPELHRVHGVPSDFRGGEFCVEICWISSNTSSAVRTGKPNFSARASKQIINIILSFIYKNHQLMVK